MSERKSKPALRMGFQMGSLEELALAGVDWAPDTSFPLQMIRLGEKYVDTYRIGMQEK